jgi:hypothetical protein
MIAFSTLLVYIVIAAVLASLSIFIALATEPVKRLKKRIAAFVTRLAGGVPWLDRDLVVLGEGHGKHQTIFVSRHHLAEGGLECPICNRRIEAGDFSHVQRTLVDGQENECIVCQGEREVENGRMVPCKTVLLASPDTEHGDHLDADGKVDPKGYDPPEYFRFVRAPADQHLREKWGVDARAPEDKNDDLGVMVPATAPAEPAKSKRDEVLLTLPSPMLYPPDNYSTHQRLLFAAVARFGGPVLELGCGNYSTPQLHGICGILGHQLVTAETDAAWMEHFAALRSPSHLIIPREQIPQQAYAVVFVDGLIKDRAGDIKKYYDEATVIVIHDTENLTYGYEFCDFSKVAWQMTDKSRAPWTTIISKHQHPDFNF